jgi:predicted DsbA family dithiol-disulfide isomerase
MAVVEVMYYTDPADPWSWAAEPALARLQCEFADEVAITYVLSGMARDVTHPDMILLDALDASTASGMPVDPRGWGGREGRAPRSTYPACLAAKAAAEQGLDGAYLRVLREGFWLRRAPLDTPDALEAAARAVPGLDHARFAIDLRSSAIAEAFGADLDRARAVEATTPTFRVAGVDAVLSGHVTPRALRDAVAAAGATARPLPAVPAAVERLGGTRATAEIAAATDLPWPRAAAQLWALAADLRLHAERTLGGELWSAAE